MNCLISSINFCPVKSLSFQTIETCEIKKDLGIINDRIFAFSRGVNLDKSKLIEKKPNERNLSNFLTLKNSPVLNKYNLIYINNILKLTLDNKVLISIRADDTRQRSLISDKLIELESSLIKPILLLQNKDFPFYDTSSSNKIFNSISLINSNSIEDFKKKIKSTIEFQRFRGNFYVNGIKAWEECNWIGRILKINDVSFKVEKNIPRCAAINLTPKTNDNKLNLLHALKKNYNHFNMGIYLRALGSGNVNLGDKVTILNN